MIYINISISVYKYATVNFKNQPSSVIKYLNSLTPILFNTQTQLKPSNFTAIQTGTHSQLQINSQGHKTGKSVDRTTEASFAIQRVDGKHNLPDRLRNGQTVHRSENQNARSVQQANRCVRYITVHELQHSSKRRCVGIIIRVRYTRDRSRQNIIDETHLQDQNYCIF